MAIATGSIMRALDVFDTHRLMKAVASIMPSTRRLGSVPTLSMIAKAIRRCSCQRSIANATRKPPSNNNTEGFAYSASTVRASGTPRSGTMMIGSSAVAASGIASSAHQRAIQPTRPRTCQEVPSNPLGAGIKSVATKKIGPGSSRQSESRGVLGDSSLCALTASAPGRSQRRWRAPRARLRPPAPAPGRPTQACPSPRAKHAAPSPSR